MSQHDVLSFLPFLNFILLYIFLIYGAFFNKALRDFVESKHTKFSYHKFLFKIFVLHVLNIFET
jgi:hypothetical protein